MQQDAILATPEITEGALKKVGDGSDSSQHNGYLYENHAVPPYHLATVGDLNIAEVASQQKKTNEAELNQNAVFSCAVKETKCSG